VFEYINDNLETYRPRIGFPFNNYFSFINRINHSGIVKDIRHRIGQYDKKDVMIWTFMPYSVDFVKRVGTYFTIYHCAGNYSVEKNNALRKHTVLKMEKELLDEADMVIAQTRSLCEKFKVFGKTIFYLPSAIDLERYCGNLKNKKINKEEFDKINRPRIGIVGYFDDDFYDIELLEYLLTERKKWSFVFIGPVTPKAGRFRRLKKYPNAFFLGYKDPALIPAYIKELDIGAIPYKTNEYMNEVSPTKFYEYVACGKPVVSTNIPDIERYKEVVSQARNKDEFLKYAEALFTQKKWNFLKNRTFQIAKENSLDSYVRKLEGVIEHEKSTV